MIRTAPQLITVAALLALAASNSGRAASPPKHLSLELSEKHRLELVWIPAGTFQMGSPATDKLAGDGEKPRREVRIEKGFYLGKTAVTFGQFQEFALDSAHRTDAETDRRTPGGHGFNTDRNTFEGWRSQYTWRNPGWPVSDDHPVGNVSWNDAVKFCQWLGKKSGKTVRLPTEAQWEYACRAGTTTVFFTGDDPASLKGYANVPDESLSARLNEKAGKGRFPFNDGYPFTAPVGKFKPNPWGLHDMTGNVFQWCADEVPGDAPRRVLRGGSYNLNVETCRCAYRGFSRPSGRYSYTGFRVVVAP
jgi:formylglycine-generating enzyme required for sulfatase activity